MISTYEEWKAKSSELGGMFAIGWGNGSTQSNGSQGPNTCWHRMQARTNGGVVPTPEAPDSTHSFALLQHPKLPGPGSTKKLWLAEIEYGSFITGTGGVRSHLMIYDRLSHMSGLVANVTTAQTTNLPTPALTRYTDGEGVIACAEWYGASGTTTQTTMTMTYTNQAGVSGRVSQPMIIGTMYGSDSGIDVIRPFSLQDGDTGVRSVESVTLAASTGGAGNFGIVLIKPLGFSPMDTAAQIERQAYRNMLFGGGVVEVKPDACLAAMSFGMSGPAAGYYHVGRIGLASE